MVVEADWTFESEKTDVTYHVHTEKVEENVWLVRLRIHEDDDNILLRKEQEAPNEELAAHMVVDEFEKNPMDEDDIYIDLDE